MVVFAVLVVSVSAVFAMLGASVVAVSAVFSVLGALVALVEVASAGRAARAIVAEIMVTSCLLYTSDAADE